MHGLFVFFLKLALLSIYLVHVVTFQSWRSLTISEQENGSKAVILGLPTKSNKNNKATSCPPLPPPL